MLRRPRLNARRQNVQRRRVSIVDVREFPGDFRNRLTALLARLDDLVFDVGDVACIDDGILTIHPHQQTPQRVKYDGRARIADMGVVVDGWPADIHRDPGRILRLEYALFTRGGVIKADCHGLMARFRKSEECAGFGNIWPALMAR